MSFKRIFVTLLIFFGAFKLFAADFYLIDKENPLSVYISDNQMDVVKTVSDMFFKDVQIVSGINPVVSHDILNSKLLVGTLGIDEKLDKWLVQHNVLVNELSGQWEAFKIQVVETGSEPVLVVVGSDARGTAYGMLELSRMIGVSPWSWWADATPSKKTTFTIPLGYSKKQQPSVQYRGIFINDEDWGLVPWSNFKFDPQSKTSLNLKTYEKVFELILRLRANTLWPAMHGCSTPFYFINGTKELADKYGIVLGTSHCEPLMRNTNGEWKVQGKGDYNYAVNKDNIDSFWTDRLKNISQYENIYTIGMRGVHDGPMEGAKTISEQKELLTKVINNQRRLLSQYIKSDTTQIPQVFMPYKEVLDVYKSGLKVPEDVTLVWCDDNYGHITKLSDVDEQKRKGGSGIYYHISYFGKPHDYLWLYSTQPGLIYSEMKKAWEHGARKLWMLNVGDIKPAEYGIEFFLDMAWDIESVNNMSVQEHLANWLNREFTTTQADALYGIMKKYYDLAAIRKPEFMGWNRTQEYAKTKRKGGATDIQDTEFNPFMFGDELQKRTNDYAKIANQVVSISKEISADKQDSYFQLVEYPVRAASAMNKKWLYAQKARLFARHSLPVANEYAQLSTDAYEEIKLLTNKYNKIVNSGKWDGIMNMHPRDLPVFETPVSPDEILLQKNAPALVWVEGMENPLKSRSVIKLPVLISHDSVFISIFSISDKKPQLKYKNKPHWLNIKEINTCCQYEKRLILSRNNKKVTGSISSKFTLVVDRQCYVFNVEMEVVPVDMKVESKKMIAWNAADHNGNVRASVIKELGHSSKAVLLPAGEKLTYEIYTISSGDAVLRSALIPIHAPNGDKLEFEISVDEDNPQIISFDTQIGSEEWKENVLRGQSIKSTTHKILSKGKHTVCVKALGNDIIVDQFMLDFIQERKFYQFPVSY